MNFLCNFTQRLTEGEQSAAVHEAEVVSHAALIGHGKITLPNVKESGGVPFRKDLTRTVSSLRRELISFSEQLQQLQEEIKRLTPEGTVTGSYIVGVWGRLPSEERLAVFERLQDELAKEQIHLAPNRSLSPVETAGNLGTLLQTLQALHQDIQGLPSRTAEKVRSGGLTVGPATCEQVFEMCRALPAKERHIILRRILTELPSDPAYVTVIEASKRLRRSPERVRQAIRLGFLEGKKQGITWWITVESLERFVPPGRGRPTRRPDSGPLNVEP